MVAATRGNHGQALAWAAQRFDIPCVICVPLGNSPEKNDAMVSLGAELVETGADYDEAVAHAQSLVGARGLTLIHSTNNAAIIAGAGTIALELVDQATELDAMVVAVGGGSQAVGALTVLRELRPDVDVYAVQAANASAIHDSWHARQRLSTATADTLADGLATRHCYDATFDALRAGLEGFVTVTESQLADAIRLWLRRTHNLAEGAGAAGLAGLRQLAPKLAGKHVAIVVSGGNIDTPVLQQVLNGDI